MSQTDNDNDTDTVEIEAQPHSIDRICSRFDAIEGGPDWVKLEVDEAGEVLQWIDENEVPTDHIKINPASLSGD